MTVVGPTQCTQLRIVPHCAPPCTPHRTTATVRMPSPNLHSRRTQKNTAIADDCLHTKTHARAACAAPVAVAQRRTRQSTKLITINYEHTYLYCLCCVSILCMCVYACVRVLCVVFGVRLYATLSLNDCLFHYPPVRVSLAAWWLTNSLRAKAPETRPGSH